ncbi:hypothetical protein ACFLRA_02395 [Bdellovibrionota bacterium]
MTRLKEIVKIMFMKKTTLGNAFRFILNLWLVLLISWPLLFFASKLWIGVPYSYALWGYLFWVLVPLFVGLLLFCFHKILKIPSFGSLILHPHRHPSLFTWIFFVLVPLIMVFAIPQTNSALRKAIEEPRPFRFIFSIQEDLVFSLDHKLSPTYKWFHPAKHWPEARLEIRHRNNDGVLYIRTEPLCTISPSLYLDFRLRKISSNWDEEKISKPKILDNRIEGFVEGVSGGEKQKGIIFLSQYGDWCVETTIQVQGSAIEGETEKTLESIANSIKQNPSRSHFAEKIKEGSSENPMSL